MSVSSYDAVAEKVLFDLELAINKDTSINEFYIIPTSEEDNKNSSPIVKGENTLGLESWIITHIYPYAHHQIMQKNNYRTQNLYKVIPCLTGVALLNPEMVTVWNKRRELIIAKKLHVDNELRLTRMTLSRKPKCNQALSHREWIITETLKDVQDKSSLLQEELRLSEMIANRYHSNYHAWSHRMWSLQHLLPDSFNIHVKKKTPKTIFFETIQNEAPEFINHAVTTSEFLFITTNEISCTYLEELETNFKWISSHVSDHSGLHFRKFLLTQILSFVKEVLHSSGKTGYQSNYCYSTPQQNMISVIITNGKMNVAEFFSSYDFGDYQKEVNDYLLKLEHEISLIDLAIFLILNDFKSNYSLCLLYSSHEALWCYRRFLVYAFRQIILALDICLKNEEKRFVHQDKNGIPFAKDFKYDTEICSSGLKHSNLFLAFKRGLLSHEEELVSRITPSDVRIKVIIRNYSLWLKNCLSIN